jgi:hypothetical protein
MAWPLKDEGRKPFGPGLVIQLAILDCQPFVNKYRTAPNAASGPTG